MIANFKKIRPSWPLVTLCIVYLYLGLHMIGSNRGVLSWIESRDHIALLKQEIQARQLERGALKTFADQLRSNHLDPDLLDEIARQQLGLSHPNEYVIWLDETP